jgi:hypothetical protein
MGYRISGFGDIHQGANSNGLGFIQIVNFLLSVQQLISSIAVEGRALPLRNP